MQAPARAGAVRRMERVLLPLKTITDRFPPELQPLIVQQPAASAIIALSVETVMEQLPQGKVEISLADLRKIAPMAVFAPDHSRDAEPVQIPLRELLAKLDPALLKRRTQRRIEIPRLSGVFIKRGETRVEPIELEEEISEAAPTTEPAAPAPAPEAEASAPTAPAEKTSPSPTVESGKEGLKKSGVISASPELHALFAASQKKSEPPPEPAPVPAPASPLPAVAPLKLSAEPEPSAAPEPKPAGAEPPAAKPINLLGSKKEPAGPVEPVAPAAPVAPAPKPVAPPPREAAAKKGTPQPDPGSPEKTRESTSERIRKLSLEPVAEPARPPVTLPRHAIAIVDAPASKFNPAPPTPSRPADAPSPADGVVKLPLLAISANWPETIREELAGADPDSHLQFPLAALGAALKRGKVALAWKDLRAMIAPTLPNPGDPLYEEALLELPLPVVAPLFMAASAPARAGQAGQRVVMDERIPAPFTQSGKQAKPPEAAPPSAPAPAPSKPEGALGMDGRLPSELVERACALGGVAGSVIALKEGLLVAARVPPELKAETLAAFLPQLFSRVEQTTESMQIGELQNLTFTAGDRPWQIWKAGNVFFAAMGRPNELLPATQLKIIAAQLARHVPNPS